MENLDTLARLAVDCDREIEALIARIAGVTISDLAESLQNDYDLLMVKKATIESKIAAEVAAYFQSTDDAAAVIEDMSPSSSADAEQKDLMIADDLFDALKPLLSAEIVDEITSKLHKMRVKIPVDMSQRRCVAQFANAFSLQLHFCDDVINPLGQYVCEVPLVKCGDVMRFAKK